MTQTIKVVKLEEYLDVLGQMFKNSILIPVIGSGFSAGSYTSQGCVPSGSCMKRDMIRALEIAGHKINSDKKSFSQVAKYYNRFIDVETRKKYIRDNFMNTKLSREKQEFLNIGWPYLYTLNLDDAIEKNLDCVVIGPNKSLEKIDYDGCILYKLHGTSTEFAFLKDGDDFSIFDTEQYIKSITKNTDLLNKLKQDYIDKNIIFIGCSLDDELDLMHVFSLVKEESPHNITEKFFITNIEPTEENLVDLECYGITTVLLVDDYNTIYDKLISIKDRSSLILGNELNYYKNISIEQLDANSDQNASFLLYNKMPFDKKDGRIYLPYYFISRNLSNDIISQIQNYPIQFICGKRISGKSYLLLDLYRRLADRDKYYFDSRACINSKNIDILISLRNTIILIDTNVINGPILEYLLNKNLAILRKNKVNFVICVNTSSKQLAFELQNQKNNSFIKLYFLENKFSAKRDNDESAILRKKLSSLNLPYFNSKTTILDNLLWMQSRLCKKSPSADLQNFNIAPDNYIQLAYLILLSYYGKLTSKDLIGFGVYQESNELMPKLGTAVEPDFRYMITASTFDDSYYQVVCNAQIWLLGYLSQISMKSRYFDCIVNAVVYIVKYLNADHTDKFRRRKLFDFIRFDNFNFILGGARKHPSPSGVRKLIQTIYMKLKSLLGEEYQFNHQHAKCLLWSIEELSSDARDADLLEAHKAAILSLQLIEEALDSSPKNPYLKISYAHVQFTIGMILVKKFFFNKTKENFINAVSQVKLALSLPENQNADELYDELTEDNNDYSVSRFMDYLYQDEAHDFYDLKIRRDIDWIATFRKNYLT